MALTKITSTNIGANAVTSTALSLTTLSAGNTVITGTSNVSGDSYVGGNILIGNTSSTYRLSVTGTNTSGDTGAILVTSPSTDGTQFRINNTSTGGHSYTLYSTGPGNSPGAGALGVYDQTANAYRMIIDASGRITTPYRPAFSAYSNDATTTDGNAIPYATTTFNIGSCYNTSTYRFTAPVSGIYFFVWSNKGTQNNTYYSRLAVNGSQVSSPMEMYASIANPHTHASALIQMSANDFAWIRSGSAYTRSDSVDYFSGYLVG